MYIVVDFLIYIINLFVAGWLEYVYAMRSKQQFLLNRSATSYFSNVFVGLTRFAVKLLV